MQLGTSIAHSRALCTKAYYYDSRTAADQHYAQPSLLTTIPRRLVVVLIGVFVPPESYAIRQKRKLWNVEQQQLATEARIAHHRA